MVAPESEQGPVRWRENAKGHWKRRNLATLKRAMSTRSHARAGMLHVKITSRNAPPLTETLFADFTRFIAQLPATNAAHASGQIGPFAVPLAVRDSRSGSGRVPRMGCATGRWRKSESARDYPHVQLPITMANGARGRNARPPADQGRLPVDASVRPTIPRTGRA